MKRSIRFPWLLLLCLTLCASLAACSGGPGRAEDRIAATFSALGVTDAEFAEQVHDPESRRDGCLLYLSNTTQMGYFFDPDTGVPVGILRSDLLDGPYRRTNPIAAAPMLLPQGNREEALLRYARDLLGSDLIGQLRVRVGQDQGMIHNYTVVESYDGIDTGTTVGFTCRSDGEITTVSMTIGSIFEPGPFGGWVIAAGEELIGEEAAIEVGRAGLQALDMAKQIISDEITCELTAAQDRLLYTVEFHFTDSHGWIRSYMATVDAHTGELWREAISK